MDEVKNKNLTKYNSVLTQNINAKRERTSGSISRLCKVNILV
jgi:hypothetical protein